MNQSQKNKVKKEIKVIPLLVVFVVFALLISAILTIITPQQEKVIQTDFVVNNYDQSKSTFKKISFSGEEISLPEKMKIYKINGTLDLSSELAQKMIDEYKLENVGSLENYWAKGAYILNKNTYENRYAFDLDTSQATNQVQMIPSEAIKSCLNFYSKYSVNLILIAQKDHLVFLSGRSEQTETELARANYIQVPLSYQLDGYPVFYQNENSYPFFCKINNNYQVERVVFKDFFYNFAPIKDLPTISLDQAVRNIKNGKASIIDAKSQLVEVIDLNWINEADLYDVSVDYRLDESLKIVYPFYKFQAKLTNAAGINIQAQIITPAVNTALEK